MGGSSRWCETVGHSLPVAPAATEFVSETCYRTGFPFFAFPKNTNLNTKTRAGTPPAATSNTPGRFAAEGAASGGRHSATRATGGPAGNQAPRLIPPVGSGRDQASTLRVSASPPPRPPRVGFGVGLVGWRPAVRGFPDGFVG